MNVLTAFVIALDQQIIENGVLHSIRVISFVSLHLLLPVSKWMPRKSRCLAASPATPRSFFYSRSDPEGFSQGRDRPSSLRISSLAWGEKTVAKKTQLCDPRLRKTSRSVGEGERGPIEMTVKKKKRRTVTPDIGTDTKSLIWPTGFFPQVDETPSPPSRYTTPFVRFSSRSVREKKRGTPLLSTPLGRPSLRPDPGKENTPHCHIGD